MRIINVDASSEQVQLLEIGYQGENEVTQVCFDISAWQEAFGEGYCTIYIKRKGDAEPYYVELPLDENIATWTVSSVDTANKGNGSAQLNYFVDSVLKRTRIYPMKVAKSLVDSGEVPDPYDEWLEEIRQGVHTVEDFAEALTDEVNDWLIAHPEATTTVQDDSLTTAKYQDSSVTTSKLADESVTEDKLGDSSVTNDKIASKSITSDKLDMNPPANTRYLKFNLLYQTGLTNVGGAAYANGLFYIITVYSQKLRINIYDPTNPSATRTINTNLTGHGGSAFYHDGKIYISAGYDDFGASSDTINSTVYVFDVATEQITSFSMSTTSTGVFVVNLGTSATPKNYLVSLGINNNLEIYRIIGNNAYYLTNYNKALVSSSMQGGYADSSYIYELKSYALNTDPADRNQNGYDLIVHRWSGDILCICKLEGMDRQEPEWVQRVGDTLFIGDCRGNIYYYELHGEFNVQTGWSLTTPGNGTFDNVVPNSHKYDTGSYEGFTLEKKVYCVAPYNSANTYIARAQLCNNVVTGAQDGSVFTFVTTVFRTGIAIGIEVRYAYTAATDTMDIAVIRVYDFINNTYYSDEASSIAFLKTLSSSLTKEIRLKSIVRSRNLSKNSFAL